MTLPATGAQILLSEPTLLQKLEKFNTELKVAMQKTTPNTYKKTTTTPPKQARKKTTNERRRATARRPDRPRKTTTNDHRPRRRRLLALSLGRDQTICATQCALDPNPLQACVDTLSSQSARPCTLQGALRAGRWCCDLQSACPAREDVAACALVCRPPRARLSSLQLDLRQLAPRCWLDPLQARHAHPSARAQRASRAQTTHRPFGPSPTGMPLLVT